MKATQCLLLLITTVLFITSCSNYTFSSNIDKAKFQQYFAPSQVKIYDDVQHMPATNRYLGAVSGESCQTKAHLMQANKQEARTNARHQAAKLSANAIIFTGCAQNKTKQCLSLVICYGQAYQIKQ
jgi:RcsF protein